MSHFDEINKYRPMSSQSYGEYVNATQSPADEHAYGGAAETEAFLAEKRSSRHGIPLGEKLNVSPKSRMPKAEALRVVRRLKGWITTGSLVAFGLLSALVAGHAISASNQINSPSIPGTGANAGSNSSSPSSGGSYFQQQQGGGYGFGNNQPDQSGSGGSSSVSGSQAS